MIDLKEATKIAQNYVSQTSTEAGIAIELQPDLLITQDFGWVFFYESSAYLSTGNYQEQLLGNAPLIVDKNGKLHFTGTAYPIDYYIQKFKESWGK